MQIIEHSAQKLDKNEYAVFQEWARQRGYDEEVAIDQYEMYCEDDQMIDPDIINFCIDLLTNRLKKARRK